MDLKNGARCRVEVPITVHFSYTDPNGALSSGPTSPASVTFDRCEGRQRVAFDTNDVSRDTEVGFSLTGVTSDSPGVANRVQFGDQSRATLTVLDGGSPPGTVSVTVTSNWLGRTVTVDGTNRTTPYTATWNSGSSHTLDVPSPQTVSRGRYVFSSWSHGGPQEPGRCRRPATRPIRPTSPSGLIPQTAPPTVTPSSPTYQLLSEPTGMSLTFAARATDPDNNLSSYEWFVNDVSIYSGPLPLTGDVTVRSLPIQFVKPGSHKVKITFTDSTGLSDSVTWNVEAKGPDLTTCPGESGSAQRGSVPYGGAMVDLSLSAVPPARGILQPEVHLC